MPRTDQHQKQRLIILLRLLQEETDENHGLTLKRVQELLSHDGITLDRKTFYSDINELEVLGYEVLRPEDTGDNSYRLITRDFELPELKFLMDAIQSSKFLSENKTKELSKKLKKYCSRHDRYALDRQIIVSNRVKSVNPRHHYNTDAIFQAIAEDKQISFKYFHFDVDKKKIYNKKDYVVSPYVMIYTDENYYLVAYSEERKKILHFRVDKMEKVSVLEAQERVGAEDFAKKDLSSYTNYTFNMYSGEVKRVEMVFTNNMVDAVLDRFGREVTLTRVDDRHFKVIVPVAVSQQFFGWVFGLGSYAKIVAPEEVVTQYREQLEKQLKRLGE